MRQALAKLIFRKYPKNPLKFFSSGKPSIPPSNNPKDEEELKEEDEKEEEDFYDSEPNKRNFHIFIGTSVSLLGIYAILEISNLQNKQKTQQQKQKSFSTGKATIGGEWCLDGIDGNPVSSRSLKGSYYLLYFGFCNCPDICPASLYKLSKAYDKVIESNEISNPLKLVFVSVDPDRDTPKKIDKFLRIFSDKIIGVTGKSNDSPELKEMMRKFRIYASRIEYQNNEEQFQNAYTIDHTIITYLMDDNNEYVSFLGSNMGEGDMARKIIENIIETEKKKMYY